MCTFSSSFLYNNNMMLSIGRNSSIFGMARLRQTLVAAPTSLTGRRNLHDRRSPCETHVVLPTEVPTLATISARVLELELAMRAMQVQLAAEQQHRAKCDIYRYDSCPITSPEETPPHKDGNMPTDIPLP